MRTRLSICKKKRNYASKEAALSAIEKSGLIMHPYKCDRGDHYHLTRRTKGKWIAKTKTNDAEDRADKRQREA